MYIICYYVSLLSRFSQAAFSIDFFIAIISCIAFLSIYQQSMVTMVNLHSKQNFNIFKEPPPPINYNSWTEDSAFSKIKKLDCERVC